MAILVGFGLLIAFLALAIPVGAALGLVGISLLELFSPLPMVRVIGEISWTSSTGFLLVSVPLFVMLGEILLRAGITDRMYGAVVQWISWLPGGLMHANIGSSAIFAALCGSSVATSATIGTVAMPELKKYGYNEKLFLGSLAAGGTLGILIPPSINLIVYGVITNTSIPRLYMAGILPGILLATIFIAILFAICLWRRDYDGAPVETNWRARLVSLGDLLPPFAIFLVVIGSIYLGWATATESAALGVVVSLILAAFRRRLTLSMLVAVLDGTMRTTAMIMLIVVAAFFLNFAMASVGITRLLTDLIVGIGLSPTALIITLMVFYLVLGCFMETMSMLIATVPFVVPIVVAAGFDPVWFGIVMVVLLEAAMVTPPVGVNLFVVQGVRREGSIADVMYGILPFLGGMAVLLFILLIFPEIALWLPRTMQ